MNILASLTFFSFFIFLFLAGYSWNLNRSAVINRVFSLATAALSIWAFSYTFMLTAPNVQTAMSWRQISAVGFCLFYAAYLHFALILTKKEKLLSKWWIYPVLYFPAIMFFVNKAFAGGMTINEFYRAYNVWIYIPRVTGFWSLGYNVYFSAYTFLALGLMIHWGTKTKSFREKKQAKLVVITSSTALLLGIYTDVYFPLQNIAFPPTAIIYSLIPASGIWYAIKKYQMLDLTPAFTADYILAIMGDPVIVFDADAHVKLANRAASEFFGYSEVEMRSLSVNDFFIDATMNGLDDLMELDSLEDVEFQVLNKRSNVLSVHLSSSVIHDDANELAGVVCVFHDITVMKASEDALRKIHGELEERVLERTQELVISNTELKSEVQERVRMEALISKKEARLRLLTDNMLDIIMQLDAHGNFTYISPSQKNLMGYEPEYLLGKSSMRFIHPDDLEKTKNMFVDGFEKKQNIRHELRCKHVAGHYLWFEVAVNFVADFKGHFQSIVLSGRDITERKLMEEQLRYLSLFDSLTGVYNRNYFEQEMARMESSRYNPVGLIICDVDGLKLYNDSLGHDAGDKLLKSIAAIIKDCFRHNDVVARVGGDEFAILMPETESTLVDQATKRVREAVENYNQDQPILTLSISIGFSVRESETESMAEIFRQADDYMYREKLHRRQSVRSAVSQVMKNALEERDFVTEGHAARLENYVVKMAEHLQLPNHTICDLKLLAQFHDIGKVGIVDKILFKPSPLSANERREIQRHSEIGHRIARSAPDLIPIADLILKHHEWWNGQGYPFGLKGEEIPIDCRILAIADAYDAMTSDRPYRKGISQDSAIKELKKFSGIQFDPHLVDPFILLLEKGYFTEKDNALTC